MNETPERIRRARVVDLERLDADEKLTVESWKASQSELGKLLIGGAGGALVLSATFIERFASGPALGTAWLLGLSWSCLLISLISSVGSYRASIKTYTAAIKQLRRIRSGKDEDWTETERGNRAVGIYGDAALWLLITGIATLSLFAFLNIRWG